MECGENGKIKDREDHEKQHVSEKKNSMQDHARVLNVMVNLMACDKQDLDSHMFEILINPSNTVDLLTNTIVDNLRESKGFKGVAKSKLVIFHKAVILLDSKQLSYYDFKNGDHLNIAIDKNVLPKLESKKRELSNNKYDFANINMIPIITKPGYQIKPVYPLLCRMTDDQLGKVQWL
jgi:hypothetical protein